MEDRSPYDVGADEVSMANSSIHYCNSVLPHRTLELMGVLKVIKIEKSIEEVPNKVGSLVHSMDTGDSVLIGDNIEIKLRSARTNRSTIEIKAPTSIPIRRTSRKIKTE